MTATADKYQEDNFKLYGRAYQAKNNDLGYFATIGDGRIYCSRKDDNKGVKPSTYKATIVRPTSAASASASTGTVTLTSSTINEQTENTIYSFSYYQITDQDRNCNCYVCSDLAAFKPKQNDAIVVSFAAAKKQPKRRTVW